jgi:preprotein translocase subunit Sss1
MNEKLKEKDEEIERLKQKLENKQSKDEEIKSLTIKLRETEQIITQLSEQITSKSSSNGISLQIDEINKLRQSLELQKTKETELLAEIDRLHSEVPITNVREKNEEIERLQSIIDGTNEKQILYQETFEDYKDIIKKLKEDFGNKEDSLYEKILVMKDNSNKKNELIRYLSNDLIDTRNKLNKLLNTFKRFKIEITAKHIINIIEIITNIIEASKKMDEKEYLNQIVELLKKTNNTEEIIRIFNEEIPPIYNKIEKIGKPMLDNKGEIIRDEEGKVIYEGDIYNYLYDALRFMLGKAQDIANKLKTNNIKFSDFSNHINSIPIINNGSSIKNAEIESLKKQLQNKDSNRERLQSVIDSYKEKEGVLLQEKNEDGIIRNPAEVPISNITKELEKSRLEIEALRKQIENKDSNRERLQSIIDGTKEKEILIKDNGNGIIRNLSEVPISNMVKELEKSRLEIEALRKQLENKDSNRERLQSIIDSSNEKQILYEETFGNYKDIIKKLKEDFGNKEDSLYEKIIAMKNNSNRKNELIRYLSNDLIDTRNKLNKLLNTFKKFKIESTAKHIINIIEIITNIIEASKKMDEKEYLNQILQLLDKTKDKDIEEIIRIFKEEIPQIYNKIEKIGKPMLDNKGEIIRDDEDKVIYEGDIYNYLYDALRVMLGKAKDIANKLKSNNIKFIDLSNHINSITEPNLFSSISANSAINVVGNNQKNEKELQKKDK